MSEPMFSKNDVYGIQFETLEAFCVSKRWKIMKKSNSKKVTDIIKEEVQKYEDELQKIATGHGLESERIKVSEETTKIILETTLENFDYETEANDENIGPAVLSLLANEIKNFLLLVGIPAAKLLQQQSNSTTYTT